MGQEFPLFLSHSGHDDEVVGNLRNALDDAGVAVHVDLRRTPGSGDEPEPAVREAIETSSSFVVVLSVAAVNAPWIRADVGCALRHRRSRGADYRVVPILLDPIGGGALPLWFGDEVPPVAIRIGVEHPFDAAVAELLAALEVPPDDDSISVVALGGTADLELDLGGFAAGPAATAVLSYRPPGHGEAVRSDPFTLTPPPPTVSGDELRWYFHRYGSWPSATFRERARDLEDRLRAWGEALYEVLDHPSTRPVFEAWKAAGDDVVRRFTLVVEPDAEPGRTCSDEEHRLENRFLAVPWELLREPGGGYLFHGRWDVGVQRRLPSPSTAEREPADPPIRVLLVSPRPDDVEERRIDHRITAGPLVEALSKLGELASLTLLTPATFERMAAELHRAFEEGQPYHVLHYDGHGVEAPESGRGALVFEDPADADAIDRRRARIVPAASLAAAVLECGTPLVILEARRPAEAAGDPAVSVASELAQAGVEAVVSASHALPRDSARRFIAVCYRELMSGRRISQAGLLAQRLLQGDPVRGPGFASELQLEDWWVPVLFQGRQDARLISRVPAEYISRVIAGRRTSPVGRLPQPPEHGFVGRSRELLVAERSLQQHRTLVLHGARGRGKTALAAELVRWLVTTEHFEQAAYVSLEGHSDARSVRDLIGQQLVPRYRFAASQDLRLAIELLERVLDHRPTILVFDHLESLMRPAGSGDDKIAQLIHQPKVLDQILELCAELGKIGRTRLVFVSREPLPKPFAEHLQEVGPLDLEDAVALLGTVLAEHGGGPPADDDGASDDELSALVESVGGHARCLVLLAGEVAAAGVRAATRAVAEIAAEDERGDGGSRPMRLATELALRRLSAEERRRLRPLAAFRGGGHLTAISSVLELDVENDEEVVLAEELIGLGLAEMLPYNYLRLDPDLRPALLREQVPEEREAARSAWVEAMVQLAEYLYGQQVKDPAMTTTLTLLELPNLLAALDELRRAATADRIAAVAATLESLCEVLGRPKALAWIEKVRKEASPELGAWSHARWAAESAAVEEALELGHAAEALTAAKALVRKAEDGARAYSGSELDRAMAQGLLAQAHVAQGSPAAALVPLDEAGKALRALAQAGDREAARLAVEVTAREGDCLLALDRLEAAVERFETAIRLASRLDDPARLAEVQRRLGSLLLDHGRPAAALEVLKAAREVLEEQGLLAEVADVWALVGAASEKAGHYDEAETAYRASLEVAGAERPPAAAALTLTELGALYDTLDRREDAVAAYGEAAKIFTAEGDLAREGIARSNMAARLILLERFDEARGEIERTIDCDAPFGHDAEPWRTFGLLAQLERGVGREEAARDAHRRAARAFYEFLRAGGKAGARHEIFNEVADAIRSGRREPAVAAFEAMLGREHLPAHLRALIPALEQVLEGSRERALAESPELHYRDAAELLVLLDELDRHQTIV